MSSSSLHVVFGAGQIGVPLARQLLSRGHQVRIVRRAGGGGLEIPVVSGDAGEPGFATEVTRGAAALYHCMNPPYSTSVWARELPRLMTSLLEAGARNQTRVVVLDNLYMFGRMDGRPMSEDTPVAPCSRKGEIRARVAELWQAAHRAGRVRAVSGRACDFYGPGGTQTYFGEMFWRRVLRGGSAQVLTPLDVPHTFHFTHDVAAGLATLGTGADEDDGRWWMLPAAPPVTVRELVKTFASALGRGLRVERIPPLVLGVMGWFVPLLRELPEMRYQWEEPYLVDDRRFRARFGMGATTLADGAAATVAWARSAFAAS